MSASTQILKLQTAQLLHDERWHRDISNLSPDHRMKHVTLHLVKYLGKMAADLLSGREEGQILPDEGLLIDSFIMVLSGAAALDYSLATGLPEAPSIEEAVAGTNPASWADWFPQMAIQVGQMAKACEALDHLENYPSRERFQESLSKLFLVLVWMAVEMNLDWQARIRERRQQIRSRKLFAGFG